MNIDPQGQELVPSQADIDQVRALYPRAMEGWNLGAIDHDEHIMTIDLTRRVITMKEAAATLGGGGLVAVPEVEDAMASTQSEVRALLESWSEAIRIKDIDRLMSLYSLDVIYFDVVPPLRFTGSAAVRGNFLRWFDGWKSSIGVEIRDLNILASGDIAVAYMLHRTSGTLKDGREVGYWVRATVCCQRSDHSWLITHEHISLPVDFKSGKAAVDLVP
jgi:ketosteroid isomerase-like protein